MCQLKNDPEIQKVIEQGRILSNCMELFSPTWGLKGSSMLTSKADEEDIFATAAYMHLCQM